MDWLFLFFACSFFPALLLPQSLIVERTPPFLLWFVPFALLYKSKVAYKLAYFLLTFLLCKKGKKSASPFLPFLQSKKVSKKRPHKVGSEGIKRPHFFPSPLFLRCKNRAQSKIAGGDRRACPSPPPLSSIFFGFADPNQRLGGGEG